MKRIIAAMLLLCAPQATAQVIVEDPGNLFQNTLQVFYEIESVINQGVQILNEYNMIRNQITSITHQVTNLQRIGADLNSVDALLGYASTIGGLLGATEGISYDMGTSMAQFDQVYYSLQRAQATTPGMVQWMTSMRQQRMKVARTNIQIQSMRASLTDLYARICNLLNGSFMAKGNLDAHQITHQQLGIINSTQQQTQAILATQARLQAQKEAEQALLEEQAMQWFLRSTTLAPVGNWEDGPQLDMPVRGSLR